MEPDRYNYLYRRYLDNNCSGEEIHELYVTIRYNTFTKENLLSVEDAVKKSPVDLRLNPEASENILKSILKGGKATKIKLNVKLYFRYASAAAILLISSFLVYNYFQRQVGSGKTFTNTTKDIKKILLEDGSSVILKSGSKLVQVTDFKQDSVRRIRLEGEAFFSIAKRFEQPFMVHSADGFEIRVLGTRFHLNFGKENKEVVLTEGRLSIANNKDKVVVSPGYKAMYSEISNTFQLSAVDTLMYTSWTNRQLYFKDTPLKEVINQLNTIYGTNNLHMHPKFKELQFTGYLPTNNIDHCKEILKKTFINQKLTFL